jgi:hypothetical protein
MSRGIPIYLVIYDIVDQYTKQTCIEKTPKKSYVWTQIQIHYIEAFNHLKKLLDEHVRF